MGTPVKPTAREEPFTVLLVDDDAMPRRALLRTLQFDGVTVNAVDGAEAALVALTQGSYQVVISDHMMPEVSGLTLLHRVAELYPSMVRVISSGSVNPTEIEIAQACGDIHLVLQKPWSMQDVRDVLDAARRQLGVAVDDKT